MEYFAELPKHEVIYDRCLLEEGPIVDGKPVYSSCRNFLTIPVEYEWPTEKIAYYKSTSTSNARRDSTVERIVRAYFWFPTLGVLQRGSPVEQAINKGITHEHEEYRYPGYIVKYTKKIEYLFGDIFLNYGYRGLYQYFIATSMPANLNQYNAFIKSQYVQYLIDSGTIVVSVADPTNPTKTELKEINDKYNTPFTHSYSLCRPGGECSAESTIELPLTFWSALDDIINVMSQYCYNWRQIQDAILLSWDNKVDGVKLSDSGFKYACNFILNYDLLEIRQRTTTNKFENLSFIKREVPLIPFRVIAASTIIRKTPVEMIEYLYSNGAISPLFLLPGQPESWSATRAETVTSSKLGSFRKESRKSVPRKFGDFPGGKRRLTKKTKRVRKNSRKNKKK
jgi:hypothetical protein